MGYTNQFNLEVGTTLNTKNVPNQLQALNAQLQKSTSTKVQIPITVDASKGTTVMKTFIKEVNTFKDELQNTFKEVKIIDPNTGEIWKNKDKIVQTTSALQALTTETHKWTNTKGEINEWVTSVDNAGQTVQKRTKQYTNDVGELITETSNWGRNAKGQWEQFGDTVVNITDNFKKTAQTLTTETHKWTDSKGEINNWTTSVDDAGQVIQTRTKQYTNDVGELVTETSKWGRNAKGQWQQLGETVRTVTDDFKKSAQVLTTETHKFVDSKGGIQTWVTTIDDTGKTVSTRTKQIIDDMGNVITKTSRLEAEAGQPFRKVGEEISKVSEIIKESTTSTNTVKGTIEDLGNTYRGLITTTEKVSSNGEYLRTVISKYTDEMGRAVERTEQFDKAGNQVATTMRKIGEATQVSDTRRSTVIDKDGNKTITEYTNGVATLRTEIKTYKDEVGNLIVQTDKYDAVTNKLISTHQELKRDIQQAVEEDKKREAELDSIITKIIAQRDAQERLKEALISTTTTYSRGKTTQFGDRSGEEYDALITKIEKVDAENKKVIQTTYEFTNAQGQLVQQTRTTDQYLNQIAEDVITINGVLKETTQAINNVSSIHKYVDGIGNLVTESVAFNEKGEKIVTTTIEQAKSFGQATTSVRVYNETLGQLISTNVQLLNDEQKLNLFKKQLTTTTQEEQQSVTRGNRVYQATVRTIQEETHEYGTLTTTITTYKNALGQTVVETRKVDANNNEVAQSTRTVTSELNSASSGLNTFNESAERANYGVRNLGWSLKDAFSRLANFYLASLPIRAVQKAITETIQTVKDFDSALIEFRKVSDLAGESLTRYVDKLAEMGELTGSTMQAMVEASTEFRKSGFTDEDSAKLASIAEMYRNIADEEISAGESASFIIAQMKAFNIEADQAEHIIDSVNEVANNFSVSSADLAKNLGNMSAIMAINNVSMEEQIGMLTGVTEITRKASSASRGLVMISSRLTQVLDESSSTGKKLTAIYDGLGIELKDENGQLRSHYDILGDLAKQWDNLSENEQKYIALTSAGARQQQNFVALMENWNQVAKATATAYQSMGSAQRENEKVMDSIAKKVEILKSEFQQLVIGDGGLQDFVKNLLNIGIAFLKFANSDVGQAIIKVTLFLTTINLLNRGVVGITTRIMDMGKTLLTAALYTQGYTTSEIAATVATMSFSDAVKILGASFLDLLLNPVVLTIAALTAFAVGVVTANKKIEEHNERIREAREEVVKLKNEIYNLSQAVQDEAKVTQVEKDKLEYLKKRLELQERIAKQQIMGEPVKSEYEYEAVPSSATETGEIEYTVTKKNFTPAKNELSEYLKLNEEIKNWNNNTEKGLELLETRFNQSQTYLNSLVAERDALGKQSEEYAKNNREKQMLLSLQKQGVPLTEEQSKRLEELSNAQTELNERDKERLEVLEANVGEYKKNIEEIKNYQEAVDEYGEESEEADSVLKEFAKDLGISETELESNANALGLSIDAYYEHAKAVKENDEALDNFQSALGTLQGAVDEYNESQYLSIDTIQALLNLQPEYLSMLVEENGQLKLNENAILDKCNALIEERKQTALQTAYDRLAAIERGENQKATENQSGAIDGNIDSLNAETSALSKNTVEQYANRIARNDKSKGTAASQVVRELEQELAILDKIGDNYSKISKSATTAGKSGKSGAKSATNAQKELNKELEETKKKYEQVIKYINKRYDREIKKIKDAKSEAVKAEEKKIKAKEKEKDHALDAIEKEIKALKKQKDARKEYWDKQIDALKKANKELKDSLELQEKLDALEKARNTRVKVYKEGQGFVYDVDQTAVAEAQKALDEYLSEKAYEDELERLESLRDAEIKNYEDRLDALEEYKDKVQENYEKQIEQMNEHKDQLSEQYDAQIDIWENYKEKFGDLVDSYEEQQNKLLFEQLMGIKDEGNNWLTRLDNLAEFVKKYNELQSKLNTGDTNVSNTATMKQGNVSSGGTKTTGTKNTNSTDKSSQFVNSRTSNRWGTTLDVISKANKHASGIGSVPADEIAVVGENPNQEIVIGSKINNGELMNLGKGTGVVNADSSRTLASMLNQVGQFGASGFGSGNGTLNNNINNDSLTINGVTIQGANINDPQTFVNGLLNLKAEALQRAYRHR